MSAPPTFLGRVQRKILPCGVPLDPNSCPCPNESIDLPSSCEDESVGKGDGDATSMGSCRQLNKLATDDIEISICLDHIFSIFCRTMRKLELSASLNALLENPKLPYILSKEDCSMVMDTFREYVFIEPCNWPCSESLGILKSPEESVKSINSVTNSDKCDLEIHRAIEILNGYLEIGELVKQLQPEFSEQAQLFLEYMKYFIEQSLKRIWMSPEECREKDLYYRKLWRNNEKAKIDLSILTKALDEQRKQHDMEMELLNSQCQKDFDIVKRVNRKCKEDIKYTVIRSERKMMMMYKASETKQKELREDVYKAESHLNAVHASNLALEKEARDKRFKIESQLLAVINKYDTEIGEKQKQMELLIEQFEEDKKKKQDLEAEIEQQAELYNAFMKEKQDAEDAIINEKLAKLMILRVVKIIQRWWRGIRERRKANMVKKKKKSKKTKV